MRYYGCGRARTCHPARWRVRATPNKNPQQQAQGGYDEACVAQSAFRHLATLVAAKELGLDQDSAAASLTTPSSLSSTAAPTSPSSSQLFDRSRPWSVRKNKAHAAPTEAEEAGSEDDSSGDEADDAAGGAPSTSRSRSRLGRRPHKRHRRAARGCKPAAAAITGWESGSGGLADRELERPWDCRRA